MKATVKELEDSLQYTQTELADLQATCSAYEERLHILQEKDIDIQMLKYNEVKLLEKIEELEAYIRQENLVIEGVPENDREVNCAGTLIASLKECAEVTATTDDLCKLGRKYTELVTKLPGDPRAQSCVALNIVIFAIKWKKGGIVVPSSVDQR